MSRRNRRIYNQHVIVRAGSYDKYVIFSERYLLFARWS